MADVKSNAVAVAEGGAEVKSGRKLSEGKSPKSVKVCELEGPGLSRAVFVVVWDAAARHSRCAG